MKNNNLKNTITLGLILIIIGIYLLLSDFISFNREKTFSKMNIELTELLTQADNQPELTPPPAENTQQPTEEPTSEQSEIPQASNDTNINYETYVGILDIPKIGFNKGFYRKESALNNVKINIKILDSSSYPDEENGNVIIIGHSGNYSNSYFGNLYQLTMDDTASITYQNKKYNYKIVNIYTDKKDGTVTVYRNESKSCLTLITCTKDDETTQTIYIMELTNIE